MRTTLELDDTVLAAARSLAGNRGISLGAAVSELAKRGLTAEGHSRTVHRTDYSYSPFPVIVGSEDLVVTPELVNELRDV